MNDSVKKLLSAIAPTVGTALGGPFGGMVAGKLSEALTGTPNATPDELEQVMRTATPEQLHAIKKVETDLKVQLKELDVDLERVHQQDRDSARNRQIALKDKTPTILALSTLLGFFGYIAAVTFLPHNANEGFLNLVIGWLGGSASTVIAYYFGSSSEVGNKPD